MALPRSPFIDRRCRPCTLLPGQPSGAVIGPFRAAHTSRVATPLMAIAAATLMAMVAATLIAMAAILAAMAMAIAIAIVIALAAHLPPAEAMSTPILAAATGIPPILAGIEKVTAKAIHTTTAAGGITITSRTTYLN